MKFTCISPTNTTLVIATSDGAVAIDAAKYAALEFTRLGDGRPVAHQDLTVHETNPEAVEDVRLRYHGSSAGSPPTLRLQISTRKRDGTFTDWADR